MIRRLSLCLVLFASTALGRTDATPIKKIRAVLEMQAAAWNRGDIDGYMSGYARERTTEMGSGDQTTRGWKAIRNRYRKSYKSREKMGHVSFPEVRITLLSADAATVVGQWKIERAGDQSHGSFSLLLRRRPEGWRIVRDYTSTAAR